MFKKMLFILIVMLLIFPLNALAAGVQGSGVKTDPTYNISYEKSPCANSNVQNAVKVVGKVVSIIQIAVPIILVIMAMIDLLKQILTDNDATSKKNMTGLIKKIISAVLVFFIIAIVKLVLTLIGANNYTGTENITSCMYYINNPW